MTDRPRDAFQGIGRRRQAEIFLRGLAGRRPAVPVDPVRLEARAREVMSARAFAYVAGGAGQERTMAANRVAFDRWRIVPRRLRDVSRRDLSTELFGERLPSPLLLAPIGVLDLAHREADLAVARAATAEGVPFVFSNQASVPMEVCARAMGDARRWFQLYWSTSDELVASLVRRAEAAGCRAIVVTLDTTLLGWRTRDLDLGSLPFLHGRGIAQYSSDPIFRASLADLRPPDAAADSKAPVNLHTLLAYVGMVRRYPGGFLTNLRTGEPRAAVQRFLATYSRPSLTWENLAYLREITTLPVLLKGILHPDDARLAVEHGIDGVIVSNHGGRQIDGETGALDALPGVVAAVDGRVPVLFDSGIRGGSDVVKALALGARAVLLGRPYVYGLATAGETGVREVIRNVLAELDITLGLAGCASVRELSPEIVTQA
jgi:isopentenyl diphosphate isomerase/L-lactate dehydrogenase-like FMN-dependent dehydrogenase